MRKLLLFFFLSMFSFQANAQDPQLFENTWYLEKVVISGTDHIPPVNSEIDDISLSIFQDHFGTQVCAILYGFTITIDNNSIIVPEFGITLTQCNLQVNSDFEVVYMIDFFSWQFPPQIYQYNIESGTNDSLVLTLTNDNGDTAIFGNELLSITEYSDQAISIYPNPVKVVLTIENASNVEVESVMIYDVLGRLVLVVEENFDQIDVSSLKSGLFFLNIETANGLITRKIIIE